jgi:hypothetical protein
VSKENNEINFEVTQVNNGYVLDVRVEYSFKRQTDIEDGKSIHDNVDGVIERIKKILTPPGAMYTPSEIPF